MKLIVGLGNPSKQYENTRHNIGFICIDHFAQKNNLTFKNKFDALYSETTINNEKMLLIKPQTYMNLSGSSVLKFVKFYHVELKDILIIYDDVDFEIGSFKIKRDGSSAGHNGINNIIELLHSEKIQRIRVGISKNNIPLIDYVLQKFNKEELDKINNILPTIDCIINDFSVNNIDQLMEKYNRKNEE